MLTDLDSYWRFIQIWILNELVPVYLYRAFIRLFGARYQGDVVSEFMNREASQALFAEREPMVLRRAFVGRPLLFAMVVAWHKPNRTNFIQGHTRTIISNRDHRPDWTIEIHPHGDVAGIGIIGVLDQLEHGQSVTSNEFVAKQL